MTAATTTRPPIPRGLGQLTRTEARLFSRDFGSVFFALIFPTVLLVGMSLVIPGMRTEVEGVGPPWDGLQVIHVFTPALVSVAIATVGLTTLPAYLAGYREQGIFRRLAATPMRPAGVLYAHMVISIVTLLIASALAVVVGVLAFDVPLPSQPLVLAASFLLGAATMLAIGLVIGGLAPKASTASGIGMLTYFPMLFFAGLWTPGPMMPDTLQTIATYTPLGAASQALSEAWFGTGTPWLQLGVMGAYTVVFFAVGARAFRWS
ncbi:ABC transporter permease [Pseudactinotalea sp. Z1748]|uniref:ABC transporter permease n=1 Tax=Pseudactinotalea sp. Z1748 TaxID=3413027 RepID=UPI003C7A5534